MIKFFKLPFSCTIAFTALFIVHLGQMTLTTNLFGDKIEHKGDDKHEEIND